MSPPRRYSSDHFTTPSPSPAPALCLRDRSMSKGVPLPYIEYIMYLKIGWGERRQNLILHAHAWPMSEAPWLAPCLQLLLTRHHLRYAAARVFDVRFYPIDIISNVFKIKLVVVPNKHVWSLLTAINNIIVQTIIVVRQWSSMLCSDNRVYHDVDVSWCS